MMWWMPLPRDDELKTLIFQGQAALFPGATVMFTPRLMASLRVSLTQWLMFCWSRFTVSLWDHFQNAIW